MYAIIRTGGKQYKVKAGDIVRVEKLNQELGSEINLTEIVFVGGEKAYVGQPVVSDASVLAVVTRQAKAPKVIVFKKKRRQGYRRMHGHRQLYTELFIKAITSPEGEVSQAETQAPVFDPVKKEKRLAALAEKKKEEKKAGGVKKKKSATKKKAASKKAKAKKTAKKAAKKKVVKKKTAKKKAVKKAATTKKTASKATTKKTAAKKTTAKKATKKKA